jgi:hypothetical protein
MVAPFATGCECPETTGQGAARESSSPRNGNFAADILKIRPVAGHVAGLRPEGSAREFLNSKLENTTHRVITAPSFAVHQGRGHEAGPALTLGAS